MQTFGSFSAREDIWCETNPSWRICVYVESLGTYVDLLTYRRITN